MNFIDKLERKFGRYAVRGLIRYIIGIYITGAVIGFIFPNVYNSYLSLNMGAVSHGQVWRLFTYLLEPQDFSVNSMNGSFFINIIFFAFKVNIFYMFGVALEREWGAFRFNLYFLSGWFLNIAAALIIYLAPPHYSNYSGGFEYIYWAMFFAFAMFYPDVKFYLFAVLPIKVKWLALLDAAYLLYNTARDIYYGVIMLSQHSPQYAAMFFSYAAAIVVSMLNFLIYFFSISHAAGRHSKVVRMRRRDFNRKAKSSKAVPRHRCAVCGRTELDDPNLVFRYCSKCNGDYEYCQDHLYNHEHVK